MFESESVRIVRRELTEK